MTVKHDNNTFRFEHADWFDVTISPCSDLKCALKRYNKHTRKRGHEIKLSDLKEVDINTYRYESKS